MKLQGVQSSLARRSFPSSLQQKRGIIFLPLIPVAFFGGMVGIACLSWWQVREKRRLREANETKESVSSENPNGDKDRTKI